MQILSSFGGEQMVPVSVFFTCRFCCLRQNTGCGYQGWLTVYPWGRVAFQARAVQVGRNLVVAGVRVVLCSGVCVERLVPGHISGLG